MWAEAVGELAAERAIHKFQVECLKEEIEIHKGVAKALMDQLEAQPNQAREEWAWWMKWLQT